MKTRIHISKPLPPNEPTLDNAIEQDRRSRLLKWYDTNHRKMPWRTPPQSRRKPNAYHVLVSEAMLQQTQVATVIPYYQRWLKELPTLEALAQSDEQDVLRLWQGLGYYSRARNLRKAAIAVMDHYAGKLPQTAEALGKLPGVGPYTAGAVASIAFGQQTPVVDGNVMRVLSRWFQIQQPVNEPRVVKQLWRLAGDLVAPCERPGDLNQALMELGATVCTPRNPKCLTCPVREYCQAAVAGVAEQLPVKHKPAAPKPVTQIILALHRRGQYLFQQRPQRGMWAGMWQLLTIETAGDDTPEQLATHVLTQFGLQIADPERMTTFTHRTTHRLIAFELMRAAVTSGRLKPGSGQWRKLDRLDDLPLAKPQLTAVQNLREPIKP